MITNNLPNSIEINNEIAYQLKLNPNYYITTTGHLYSAYRKGAHGVVDLNYIHPVAYGQDKDGYYRVVLSDNSNKQYIHIHTLVVQQFIGNVLYSGLTVNHKDGNIHNNCVDNLEIVTNRENTQHAHLNGLCLSDHALLVTTNNISYYFNSKAECNRIFPELSIHYLSQIEQNIILPSMIYFQKETDSRYSKILAYYNGMLYFTFNSAQQAGEFFGLAHSTVSSAIINKTEYRMKVNKYHIKFL